MSLPLIIIDGGVLEGGGQILRMSMAFSALLRIPIRVYNIRHGRNRPGLRAQHLEGIRLLRDVSDGRLEGDTEGSSEIVFYPGRLRSGEYFAATKTAGSIALLIQVALPCVLFSEDTTVLKLRGGTNAEMAPQIDYMTEVFRPVLEKFGASFDYMLIKRGYFPRGGGEVHIRVKPVHQLNAVTMINAGSVLKVSGWAFVAGSLPLRLSYQMADAATRTLNGVLKKTMVTIEAYKELPDDAVGNGSGINLVAETSTRCILGGSAVGNRDQTPEQVGQRAAEQLVEAINNKACVDSYCQDQLIIFMAIAKGLSRIQVGPITLHTKTAIHVAEIMSTAKFTIINQGPNSNIIECTGIGVRNSANVHD